MMIVFHCQSCGARFDVDPRLAGRPGRCKSCGQRMVIPGPSDLASMRAMPGLPTAVRGPVAAARAPVAAARRPAPAPAVASSVSWIAAVNSNVGLAPLSVHDLRSPRIAAILAELAAEDKAPPLYDLARGPKPTGPLVRPAGKAAGALTMFWRNQLRGIQKPLRWLNDAAYLVSVPFLIAILLGVILRNRPMAHLGATVVILLNVGRFVTGLANLIIIPFKEGIPQGVSFLIPPMTFVYLANHWKGMRKPTRREVEPAVTIGLVVLAFSFIPWLSRKGGDHATVAERLSAGAGDLETEIRDQVGRARSVDLDQLKAQAEGKLKGLGGALPGAGGAGKAGAGDDPTMSPEALIREQMKGLGERVRDQVNDATKEQP